MARATVPTFSTVCRCVVLVFALATFLPAAAEERALLLTSQGGALDAWPAVTVLADPTRALSPEQILDRRGQFAPPDVHHANLGVRMDAFWLRIPLAVLEGAPARWMLSVDYPSIDRIEVHLVEGDRVRPQGLLGRSLPFSLRVWSCSAHEMALELAVGPTMKSCCGLNHRVRWFFP